MNFLRNLIQGSQSANKSDSGHKKKGPGGGLGIPPAPENLEQQQEGEGPREPQVITQEHQQQHHITGFPTSLTSTSTPSVSPTNSPTKECDTGSVSEDTTTTTSTNYSSCVEVTTPSEETPLPYNCVGGKIHESTTNSASDTVAQNSTQNGAEKDSEYESAEEVDLPPDPAPSGDLQPVSCDKSPSCEANESETTRREVNDSGADFPGDQNKVISDPLDGIVLQKEEFIPQVSETLDINGEKTSVTIGTGVFTDCQPSSVIVDKDSHSVPQEQSENLPSVISDSVVTVTKSEIIEESISNKEVVIDECVIVSPNDIQLFEKISEVVSPHSQCIENNIGSDLTAPEANNISVCNVDDEASSQNISVSREGGHRSEVQSDGETQDRSCDNHSDIQADSFPGDIVNNPETSVTAQGTEEREKSPLKQPITQDDIPEPLSPSEKEGRGIEDPQPPQYTEDPNDIPIPPTKGYNLDFLDNIDDSNFNPFATKTAVRSTPPPSPDPTCKLPPLKPAVRKKDKKTAPADSSCKTVKQETEKNTDTETETEKHLVGKIDKGVCELQTVVSPATDNAKNNNSEEVFESGEAVKTLEITVDNPVKPPRKLGVKPNVINKNKTVTKAPPEQKSIEKNNNTVADKEVCDQENRSDPEELPLPPSKGYNLDFLDDLDDPNFNPFATKTAVRSSPPKGEFTTLNNKEEEPKPKVVAPKKTPTRKGFVALKSKAKTPGCNKDTKSISNKLEDKKVSEASSGKQAENTKEEEEEVVPPSAGYNLDFLDDPNFDPFETRSGVIQPITGSTKPSGVQENSSDIVKQQSIGSSNGNSNLELDVNENIDVEKESGVQKEKSNNAEELSETDSGKDFGKEVLDVCDHSNKDKAELTTEENCDVNDNSQPSVEKSGDEEETTNSESVNLEKELERKRTYTLPEQEQFNVLENLESGLQIKVDSEVDKTIGVKNLSVIPGAEENVHKVPTIGTIGQLDSLEFDQLLGHEASRLAEEFMNCSTDSGLPDSDESTPVKSVNSVMADTSCANTNLDENVNPFQKSSRLSRSPPLGKRGAVCGAESSDAVSRTDPFMTRRSLKRESVLGEERMETRSMDDDSGIALGSRSDLEETDANHSEAGPEIATGLTSSDLRCASQLQEEDQEGEFSDHITDEEFLASEAFFKEATDLENQLRKTLISPLLGSHSKLSSEEGTPTKERKDPGPSITPESPQNKPVPSTSSPARPTSSPAPPPREERSAPEGTSSPTPRPTDTSERKLSSTRPTSAPPEGYMTATEVQELLKRQERKFEEKLLQVELAAGEKEKKLQQAMKDDQKEKASLGSSVSELAQSRDALMKMVGQYKGMLASLVSEKEKEKQAADEKIKGLETERNQALDDLANVEVAFSDVHRKYERTKQVVDTLRRNEDTLRGAVADYETKLQKQEQKFIEFQKHAEEKIQLANEEFENMRRTNEQEMTKMAALLKKAEMKIMSLQDAHDRKVRENQELTQLCDDLINKVGK